MDLPHRSAPTCRMGTSAWFVLGISTIQDLKLVITPDILSFSGGSPTTAQLLTVISSIARSVDSTTV